MATLAIKGHKTRGKEVIEILEMLGGKDSGYYLGDSSVHFYFIDKYKCISFVHCESELSHYASYELEEFLEKFPYKTGDKVRVHKFKSEVSIEDMMWDGSEVQYEVFTDETEFYSAEELNAYNQPYTEQKEENMKETKKDLDLLPTDYLEFVDNDDTWADEVELNLGDSYEIQVRDGKTFAVKKKPQYSKTYEKCCEVLGLGIMAKGYKHALLTRFQELLIARDAYWKIAGDWKPDYDSECSKYTIRTVRNIVHIDEEYCSNSVLAFPTEEMRNTFFENFKELIEECKELL